METANDDACPGGSAGEHEPGCRWAGGRWFLGDTPVKVLGAGARKACVVTGDGEHLHVSLAPSARPALTRREPAEDDSVPRTTCPGGYDYAGHVCDRDGCPPGYPR